MTDTNSKGRFSIIDSFAIRQRGEFYLIGNVDGDIQENWFINIIINSGLSLSVKISRIDEVEFSNGGARHLLLTLKSPDNNEDFFFSFMLGMNIGTEMAEITIEGAE